MHPSIVPLFEDGSWMLEKLRWRGWGKSVARANGISSSSNCIPNCTAGKRTNVPARFVLSSPGRVRGHRVYRCFQLTVPTHPKSDEHDCLRRQGTLIAYTPVAHSAPKSVSAQLFTPSRNITCVMTDSGPKGGAVVCDMQKPPAIANLSAGGSVTICQHHGLKCTGNLGISPKHPPEAPVRSFHSSRAVPLYLCDQWTHLCCEGDRQRLLHLQAVCPAGWMIGSARQHHGSCLDPLIGVARRIGSDAASGQSRE